TSRRTHIRPRPAPMSAATARQSIARRRRHATSSVAADGGRAHRPVPRHPRARLGRDGRRLPRAAHRHPAPCRHQAPPRPLVVARFFNEARLAALLQHPGLVDVYDFGRLTDGRAYIVMEYLEGQTLAALLRQRGKLGSELAVGLTRQIAGAVGVAHAKGIVHRDLKPDNIFIVRDDDIELGVRARILDFGIAKLAPGPAGGASHTRTGSLLGTPVYMAPEQCRGAGAVDWRADIYSLGCILSEILTGRRVFVHEGVGEIIAAHLTAPPPKPSAFASLPGWLDAVVVKALAKTPAARWQSMDELATALGRKRKSTVQPPEESTALQ